MSSASGTWPFAIAAKRRGNNRGMLSCSSPNDGRLQGSGLYPATQQGLRPLVVQGIMKWRSRGGTYTGIDIALTRSALMSKLDEVLPKRAKLV